MIRIDEECLKRLPVRDYGSMDSDPGYVDPRDDPEWGDDVFTEDYESSVPDDDLCALFRIDAEELNGL